MSCSELEDSLRAAMESAVRDELPPRGLAERVSGRRRRAGVRALILLAVVLTACAALVATLFLPGKPQHPIPAAISQPSTLRLLPAQRSGPLYAAQTALLAAGHRTQFRRTFTDVLQDPAHHRVLLYVTDPATAGPLLSAAHRHGPAFRPAVVTIVRARYSAFQLANAANRLLSASIAKRLPFAINAALTDPLPAPPGSGLQVVVDHPAAARRLAGRPVAALGGRSVDQLAGVPLEFVGGTVVPLS